MLAELMIQKAANTGRLDPWLEDFRHNLVSQSIFFNELNKYFCLLCLRIHNISTVDAKIHGLDL